MEQSASPEALVATLNELTYNSNYGLISIHRKIIPLLTTEDINRLVYILDNDVLYDKRNYYKHIVFLKYVIEIISANDHDRYSLENQMRRVKRYKDNITKEFLNLNEQAYLRTCAKLDWLLKDIYAPLPPELYSHADKKLITLASLLMYDTPFVPQFPQIAGSIDKEDLVHYFQQQACYRLSKMNKSILVEPVVVLLQKYNPKDDWNKLELAINRQSIKNKEFIKRLELRSTLKLANSQAMLSDERWNSIEIYCAQMLNHLPLNTLKLLITFLVNPYIQPQIVRYLFVLKFLTFAELHEKPFPHEDLPILKEVCMRIMSHKDSIHLNEEEMNSFRLFLNELHAILTKEGLPSDESSLCPRRVMLIALPAHQKELLINITSELLTEIDKRTRKDDRSPSKRKHHEIEDKNSEESFEEHSGVQSFLSRMECINKPELKRNIALYLLNQAPFKEITESKEQLLKKYEELLKKATIDMKMLEEKQQTEHAKYEKLVKLVAHFTEQVQSARGSIQERIQGLDEGMKNYESIISLYKQQLEEVKQERDQYKLQAENQKNS